MLIPLRTASVNPETKKKYFSAGLTRSDFHGSESSLFNDPDNPLPLKSPIYAYASAINCSELTPAMNSLRFAIKMTDHPPSNYEDYLEWGVGMAHSDMGVHQKLMTLWLKLFVRDLLSLAVADEHNQGVLDNETRLALKKQYSSEWSSLYGNISYVEKLKADMQKLDVTLAEVKMQMKAQPPVKGLSAKYCENA